MSDRPAESAAPRVQPPIEESVRETLESIVIAFVLAFVFRAFVVEAFVIPTGSMAPTLLGEHYRVTCPQCGWRFSIGGSNGGGPEDRTPCPMCEYAVETDRHPLRSGDRILVLKYLYDFLEPRRWDVVVFKNVEDPQLNYIKRLVGLPGEQLWIVGGNVYTRPLADGDRPPDDASAWQVQRKPEKVQRAVWQPVYHSDYYPLDAELRGWRPPWRPAGPTAGRWRFERAGPRWRYEDPQGRAGTLRFDFDTQRRYYRYAYNLYAGDNGDGYESIEEMRIAATLMPEREGLEAVLACSDRDRDYRGIIAADGTVRLQTRLRANAVEQAGQWTTRAQGKAGALAAGRASRVELWHADQAVSLWVDGRRAARWRYDVDVAALAERRPNRAAPKAEITVRGAPVLLRSVDLDRDLYYTQSQSDRYRPMGQPPGTAPLGTNGRPAMIRSDQFYCLGDNSPQSKDSRLWESIDPTVRRLVDVPVGYVPRELMMGRAFFVYFPAPWGLDSRRAGLIPNFGDMRFIR